MVYSKRNRLDLEELASKIKTVIDEIKLKIENKEKFSAKKNIIV